MTLSEIENTTAIERMLTLSFDTETTGMIDWDANDLSLPLQPQIC